MINYKYITAHADEKVYAIIHRHWFNIARQYIPLVLLILLLLFGMFSIPDITESLDIVDFTPLLYFIISILYVIIWLYAFFIWVDYHLDIWIITSSRIINVEQKGFFSRVESELDYSHIQDVSSETHGIIHTLLNYGDVIIQTAGHKGKFLFRNVAKPERIRVLIMHLHRQALGKRAHPQYVAEEKKQQ